MTMIPPRGAARMPEGTTVAKFNSYEDAQAAVNKIAEADVDVKGIAIIGSELRLVERVVARLTYGRVALAGAMRGLYFGLFLGIAMWLIMPAAGLTIVAMPALGIAFGMLLGVVTHSLTKRNREFQSVQQVLPARFELVAPNEALHGARQALGLGSAPAEPVAHPLAAPQTLPKSEQHAAPEQPPATQEGQPESDRPSDESPTR